MRNWLIPILALIPLGFDAALAAPPGIYVKTVEAELEPTYQSVYQGLEENRFWVVFEADMGARMAGFAERWGDDYNRSGLSGVKSMVFCHIWWTNHVANADPDLLALCPLHLSFYAKDGKTSVVFPRPSVVAKGTKGEAVAAELERELVGIIESALGEDP